MTSSSVVMDYVIPMQRTVKSVLKTAGLALSAAMEIAMRTRIASRVQGIAENVSPPAVKPRTHQAARKTRPLRPVSALRTFSVVFSAGIASV